jgi:hypothetical protein
VTSQAPCHNLPLEQIEWFHGKDNYAKAKRICKQQCSAKMRQACLEIALEYEVPGVGRYGVWGGLSANERNEMFGRVVA